MKEHTGALYIKRAGKYLTYTHTGEDVQQMQQTIKGLDRATVHHTARFARLEEIIKAQDNAIEEKDNLIATLKANQLTLQKKVEELDCHLHGRACDIAMQTK